MGGQPQCRGVAATIYFEFDILEVKSAKRESMAPLAVNRIGLLKSLLSSLVILILGAVALWAKRGITPSATILWLGPILLLVWSTKLRLVVNGVAVEFTPEGLTDHTTNLGFIAWSEIVSARRTVYWFGQYVELELKNPGVVIARLPWLRALALKSNLRLGLPGACINADWVSGSAKAIFASLRTRVPTAET